MRALLMLTCAIAPLSLGHAAGLFDSTLFMPGPLNRAHAELEATCSECHGDDGIAGACRRCHEEIAADIERTRGFHGRAANGADCLDCHTDHEGRDAPLTDFIEAAFPHEETDFPLEGAHRLLGCDKCHGAAYECPDDSSACVLDPGATGGEPLRKDRTPTECRGCHQSPHGEALEIACNECHGSDDWTSVSFDHDATDFPLHGAHRPLACAACHTDLRLGVLRDHRCVACHRDDDAHAGHFGPKCGDCHSEQDWTPRFDHDATDFPLRGAHQTLDCFACHGGQLQVFARESACVDCHRGIDPHEGALGAECDGCHDQRHWKPVHFDHASTDFPLEGAHREASCLDCHGNRHFTGAEQRCAFCHANQNPHGDGYGQCEACHTATDWRRTPKFDHEFTAFPLLGLHAAVPCFACHQTRRFADTASQCHACHDQDDVHHGVFGSRCETCHAASGWQRVLFDHDAVGFPLDGAHDGLECSDCHRKARPDNAPVRPCGACHRADDVHGGEFGSDCARCHTTTTFEDVLLESLQ